jgi:hypothetical protein
MIDYNVISSDTYMICPKQLVDLNLQINPMNRGNCFEKSHEHKDKNIEERQAIYDDLKEKIKSKGFSAQFPIKVKINREKGVKDKILDGHHRLAIALELELPVVPVRFVWSHQPHCCQVQ